VFYLLSTNSAEVLTILIAVIMGLASPLRSIQILWLNLVTDGAPAIALALEPVSQLPCACLLACFTHVIEWYCNNK
jgi:Ca2+-transporting ATPase